MWNSTFGLGNGNSVQYYYKYRLIRYDAYRIFYIPVKSKKEKEKKCHEKFASSGFEPGPSENIWSKKKHLYPLDHLGKRRQSKFKRGIYSFSMVTDSFHNIKT